MEENKEKVGGRERKWIRYFKEVTQFLSSCQLGYNLSDKLIPVYWYIKTLMDSSSVVLSTGSNYSWVFSYLYNGKKERH